MKCFQKGLWFGPLLGAGTKHTLGLQHEGRGHGSAVQCESVRGGDVA